MQLGLLGKQNLAMNPKRRKRLRRLGNDFGHICFKVSLPTNCVESRCKYVFFCENLGAPSSFLGCICAKIIKFDTNI